MRVFTTSILMGLFFVFMFFAFFNFFEQDGEASVMYGFLAVGTLVAAEWVHRK